MPIVESADVVDVAWSPDNSFLATCGLDRTIMIWETETFGKLRHQMKELS